MKQSVLNSIEDIKEFLVNLFCKHSNNAVQKIESHIRYLNKQSKYTKRELATLIKELKKLPKQREDQLRERVKGLQHLPKPTRKELGAFIKLLGCFPNPTDEELSDLLEYMHALPQRMQQKTDAIVERLGQLPLHSSKLSDKLIEDISNLKLPIPIHNALIAYINSITLSELQKLEVSISHLEEESQEQLIELTWLIKKYVPNCAMIVLFGSYARGRAVIYDEYYVNGVRTSFQSDFDILVVLPSPLVGPKTAILEERLGEELTEEYDAIFADEVHAPPQFIVETELTVIQNLKRKQPFFSDIIRDGIMLFDNGKVILPEPKEFTFAEKKEFAEEGFELYMPDANAFLRTGYFCLSEGDYKICAFQLHQACENYYHALGMVFINYTPKLYKLNVFLARTKGYSRDLATVFPRNTAFERNTFALLCQAYIKARYDKNYKVTKEELEYMIERIEIFKAVSYKICKEQIAYYGSKIETK